MAHTTEWITVQRYHKTPHATETQANVDAQVETRVEAVEARVVGWVTQHGHDQPWDGVSMFAVVPDNEAEELKSGPGLDGRPASPGNLDRGHRQKKSSEGGTVSMGAMVGDGSSRSSTRQAGPEGTNTQEVRG